MKILITGSAGFIGGHLANKWLDEGAEVHLLDNFSRGIKDPFLQIIINNQATKIYTADLLQKDFMNQLDEDYD